MSTICEHRKAFHEYFIHERLEVGMELLGWEVKSIRSGKVQISESHIIDQFGEIFCLGSHIAPLVQAGTHLTTDPLRTRKLLARRKDIDHFIAQRKVAGYTIIPLNLHWNHGKIKMEIALAKGKKLHDKREVQKNKEAGREVERALKQRT